MSLFENPSDYILHSSLSQFATLSDQVVKVLIYRRGNDPWTYKVVNEYGSEQEAFATYPTAEDALKSAVKTLKQHPDRFFQS